MSLIFTQGIPPLEKYRIKIFGATAATWEIQDKGEFSKITSDNNLNFRFSYISEYIDQLSR